MQTALGFLPPPERRGAALGWAHYAASHYLLSIHCSLVRLSVCLSVSVCICVRRPEVNMRRPLFSFYLFGTGLSTGPGLAH